MLDSIRRDRNDTSYEADTLPPSHHGQIWDTILTIKKQRYCILYTEPFLSVKTNILTFLNTLLLSLFKSINYILVKGFRITCLFTGQYIQY